MSPPALRAYHGRRVNVKRHIVKYRDGIRLQERFLAGRMTWESSKTVTIHAQKRGRNVTMAMTQAKGQRSHKVRAKAKGLCINCGCRPPRDGRLTCTGCNDAAMEYIARSRAKNGSPKAPAHCAVRRAVRRGELVPQPCETCGTTPTHGHHDDD